MVDTPLTPVPSPPHSSSAVQGAGGLATPSSLSGASHALANAEEHEDSDVVLHGSGLEGEASSSSDDDEEDGARSTGAAAAGGDEMVVEDSGIASGNGRSTRSGKSARSSRAAGGAEWGRAGPSGSSSRRSGGAGGPRSGKGAEKSSGGGGMEGEGGNKLIDLDYLGKLTFDPFLEQEEAKLKIAS